MNTCSPRALNTCSPRASALNRSSAEMVENSGMSSRLQHQKSSLRRWVSAGRLSSYKSWFLLVWILAFFSVFLWQKNIVESISFFKKPPRPIPRLRPHVFNLTDFGAVGDGLTINTKAFEDAVVTIAALGNEGGGQLNVQAGLWLTAPFNLTSHMTLFLAEEAVILAVQDEKYWPLMPPLPSYGYGREHHGPRYGSLIHGQHLQDVVITGYNGTIDGQGQSWWTKFRQKQMNYTRGRLVQFMWSSDIEITNITLRNSPFWTLHPYDCKNVFLSGLTILAPLDAPNTDGIDPDSCQNCIIENSYISVGDDCIAIKSGWDQYGIAYGRPSANITIRNLILRSRVSAAVSIGSEMSGGVSNVTVENILVWQSRRGVRIKTSPGRGGYVRDIYYRNLKFDTLRVGIVIKTDYGEHPDDKYDPNALPTVENLYFNGAHGTEVRVPVRIYGREEIPVKNVEFRDMNVGVTYKKKNIFQCTYIQGKAIGNIFPRPCENLALYDDNGRLVRPAKAFNESNIDYDF